MVVCATAAMICYDMKMTIGGSDGGGDGGSRGGGA